MLAVRRLFQNRGPGEEDTNTNSGKEFESKKLRDKKNIIKPKHYEDYIMMVEAL